MPAYVVGADPEYLIVQYMGLSIEISIEVFIDRHGVDLPCHRRTNLAASRILRAGRRVDDLQYLGGRGLLLQSLARLGQEPRILHRGDRLRREVFEQRNLLVSREGFCTLAREGAETRRGFSGDANPWGPKTMAQRCGAVIAASASTGSASLHPLKILILWKRPG